MAFKGRSPQQPNFEGLEATLVNSRLQQENNALYQTIKLLIDKMRQYQDITNGQIAELSQQVATLSGGTATSTTTSGDDYPNDLGYGGF
jgi:hypothetical protein